MKTDGHRQAVFNTAELLETILLDLPMKQLFTIKRVSKQFRDCVSTSIKLQEKMFLRPTKVEKEPWTLRRKTQDLGGFWAHPQCEFVTSSTHVANQVHGNLQPARPNPIISSDLEYSGPASERLFYGSKEVVDLDVKALLAHPGSWQSMYLTDPPCYTTSVYIPLTLNTDPLTTLSPEDDLEISCEHGLTFKTVVDALTDESQTITVYRPRAAPEKMETSVSALIGSVQYQKKKKGHMIKTARASLQLPGIVFPTEAEWDEVKRKSNAAGSESV